MWLIMIFFCFCAALRAKICKFAYYGTTLRTHSFPTHIDPPEDSPSLGKQLLISFRKSHIDIKKDTSGGQKYLFGATGYHT